MEEEKQINIGFQFTDEFNQETSSNRTLNVCVLEDTTAFDLLVEEFKNFMILAGFHQDSVAKIQVIE